MTRKVAIEILKELWRYEKSDKYTDEEIREAISVAISSLETDEAYQLEYERTTKNDLGVDREDAVERLNALKQFIGYDKDSEIVKATQKSLDMAISALEHPERNVVVVLDKIRAEIIKYEGDCRLSVAEYPSCKQCTDNVFDTIYAIHDKYKAEVEPQKRSDKE